MLKRREPNSSKLLRYILKYKLIPNYFKDHLHNKYTKYAFIFFLCELLNLVVVIIMIFFTDRSVHVLTSRIFIPARFLNYQFFGYGYGVWWYYSLPPEERRS